MSRTDKDEPTNGIWTVEVTGAVGVAGVAGVVVVAVIIGEMSGMWVSAELSGVVVPGSPVWCESRDRLAT